MVILMASAVALFLSQFIVEAVFYVLSFYTKQAVGASTGAAATGFGLVLQQAQAAALGAWSFIWEHFLRAPYELTVRILTTSFSTTWGRDE